MKTINKFCALILKCRLFNLKSFAQTSCNLAYFVNLLKYLGATISFKVFLNNVYFGKLPDTKNLTCYLRQIISASDRILLKKRCRHRHPSIC